MTEKIDIDRIKKLKYQMSIGMSVLIVVLITIITVLIVGQSNEILTRKVMGLAYDLNLQTNKNLESYVDNVEATSMYIYANGDYVAYDTTKSVLNEQQRNQLEASMTLYFRELRVMEDYVDLGIIYRNGDIVGKVTDETISLYSGDIFSQLESALKKSGTHKCWIAGYNDNYDKIYFVRRMNDNAIYVSSFYSTQLKSAVMLEERVETNLNLRLLSEDGRVIFSRNEDELGMTISPEERSIINEKMSSAWVDNEQLVAITKIRNGWLIVANAKTAVLLKQRNEIITYVVIVSSIGIVISILITVGLSVNLIVPAENLIRVLFYQSTRDSLTGFYNKKNFENYAKETLAGSEDNKYALLYIDINDLKGINARRGHEFGDKLIVTLSESARVTFGEKSIYGRTDGDEFAILYPVNETSSFAEEYVEKQCVSFRDSLENRLRRISRDENMSLSIGVVMIPDYGRDYDLLYDLAERAVYANKHEDDMVCHFYDYAKDYNVWKKN